MSVATQRSTMDGVRRRKGGVLSGASSGGAPGVVKRLRASRTLLS
jgi:hypothetical protein